MAVWIRVSELPLEVMNTRFLRKLGNCLGILFKIDLNTSQQERGKFARLCVEIELDKPLDTYIRFGNFWCKLEYEGLGLICFQCGKFGHNKEGCPLQKANEQPVNKCNEDASKETPDHNPDKFSPPNYGPWMQVPLSNRGKKNYSSPNVGGKGKGPALTGSRFKALTDQQEVEDNPIESEDPTDKAGYVSQPTPKPKTIKKRTNILAKSRPSLNDTSNFNPKTFNDQPPINFSFKPSSNPKSLSKNQIVTHKNPHQL